MMKPSHPWRFPALRQRAFSLLEMLVAVTLLTVIIVGLLAMFYETQRAFRTAATQEDVLEAGRATMQLISRELQELSPSGISNVVNFAVTNESTIAQPLPGGGTWVNFLQDLMILTRRNDEWSGIAYQVSDPELGPSTLGLGVGTLYRFTTNSSAAGMPYVSQETWLAARGNHTDYHRIADGIVHFRLTAYDQNGLLLGPTNGVDTAIIPNGTCTICDDNFCPCSYIFWNTDLPAYVDLELGVLEPKALAQFRAKFNPNNVVPAKNFLVTQAGKVHLFKQRIPIRSAQGILPLANVP
jgi:prepilin-type N-terminal cleavage/methylation domain-containing protein